MSEIQKILDDKREIAGLTCTHADIAWVGSDGVTAIVAYPEPGNGAYIPFYAVKKGDKIAKRVT